VLSERLHVGVTAGEVLLELLRREVLLVRGVNLVLVAHGESSRVEGAGEERGAVEGREVREAEASWCGDELAGAEGARERGQSVDCCEGQERSQESRGRPRATRSEVEARVRRPLLRWRRSNAGKGANPQSSACARLTDSTKWTALRGLLAR